MQKALLVFVALSLLSLGALASAGRKTGPGDPAKSNPQKPAYSMSRGYFSLFTLFTIPEESEPDTLKQPRRDPRLKDSTRKPE